MFSEPAFGIAIGLVALTLAILLPWLRRRASRLGASYGDKLSTAMHDRRLPGVLEQLGQSIVLKTSPESAHELVTAVVHRIPKKAVVRGPGRYALRGIEPEDLGVALVSVPEGALLGAHSFRDYFGLPQGAPALKSFLTAVGEEAAARGIEVTAGPISIFTRTEQIDAKNSHWARTSTPMDDSEASAQHP